MPKKFLRLFYEIGSFQTLFKFPSAFQAYHHPFYQSFIAQKIARALTLEEKITQKSTLILE